MKNILVDVSSDQQQRLQKCLSSLYSRRRRNLQETLVYIPLAVGTNLNAVMLKCVGKTGTGSRQDAQIANA
jgi:uncharacterized paraquat-inducible protein A